jgi:hypothetical protein
LNFELFKQALVQHIDQALVLDSLPLNSSNLQGAQFGHRNRLLLIHFFSRQSDSLVHFDP